MSTVTTGQLQPEVFMATPNEFSASRMVVSTKIFAYFVNSSGKGVNSL